MLYNHVIYLISETVIPGPFSDEGKKEYSSRKVYANEYSVSLAQKQQARTDKLRIQGRFAVHRFEYQKEPYISVDGERFKILDASPSGDEMVLTYGEEIGS